MGLHPDLHTGASLWALPTRLPRFSLAFSKFLTILSFVEILFLGTLSVNLQKWHLRKILCPSQELGMNGINVVCLFKMRRTVPRQGVNTSGYDFLDDSILLSAHPVEQSKTWATPSAKESDFCLCTSLRPSNAKDLTEHCVCCYDSQEEACLNQWVN